MSLNSVELQDALTLINDPVKWVETYLKNPEDGKSPLRLRNYQRDILSYRGRKKVLRMGRRMGKTVAMCAEIIWKAVTYADKQILVVAPYQAQIDLIFDFITKMMHDVPDIESSCSVKRSPFYRIELGNGSVIKGFTAGTRSGQAAESIRGQDGTDIYLDEVDYMGAKAVGAVKAIEASRPHVEVWASSTPSGKREQFYMWCFPSGTNISLANGLYVQIEDIKTGDKVLAASGEEDKVVGVYVRAVDEDGIKLSVRGIMDPLVATKEHPVWAIKLNKTRGEFVPICDIKVGEHVEIPVVRGVGGNITLPDFPIDRSTSNRLESRYTQRRMIDSGYRNVVDKRRHIAFNRTCEIINTANSNPTFKKSLYRLLGYYLAEGNLLYTTSNGQRFEAGVEFSLNSNETEYRDEILTLGKSVLGLDGVVYDLRKYGQQCQQIAFHGNFATLLFRHLGGEYSDHKMLHQSVFLDTEFYMDIVDTYFNGDGCYIHNGRSFVTVSKQLAIQIWQLLLRSGKVASIRKVKKTEGKKQAYLIYEFVTKDEKHGMFLQGGHLYSQVTSTETEHIHEQVYNFETLYTHTYVANGVGVHNCTNPEAFGFRHFHYTIRDLPHYTTELEKMFRMEAPDENHFAQEYLADWGNEAQGVYPQELIDSAVRPYSYKPLFTDGVQLPGCLLEHQPGQNIYVMGVDWNAEGVGTRVVVWEWMIASHDASLKNKFRVFYHENVNDYLKSRGVGYQHNIDSTKRVIQLAEHFACSNVYTDKGYGHTNLELIFDTYKKKGQLEKAIRMYKPVDFGSKVQIQSPDGRIVEKFAKEFIVSNAQRFLESDMLIFPSIEDEKYKLVGQFREFVVEKIGVTGRRKYTDVNEDSHTAAILGLFALFENFSVLSSINREEEVVRKSRAVRKDLPARDVGALTEKHIPGSNNAKPTDFSKLAGKHGFKYVDGSKGDPRDDTMSEVKAMRINKVARHINSGPPRRRTNVSIGGRRNI